jgi:DNA-binding transcriptional MerR regulator
MTKRGVLTLPQQEALYYTLKAFSKESAMIKIGDFSKLARVSIKALRYYDEIGLLKPVSVDQYTGYRYYSTSQLPRLIRIIALKDMGLSLEEIAKLLGENFSVLDSNMTNAESGNKPCQ